MPPGKTQPFPVEPYLRRLWGLPEAQTRDGAAAEEAPAENKEADPELARKLAKGIGPMPPESDPRSGAQIFRDAFGPFGLN
jgi:hypothetical protein